MRCVFCPSLVHSATPDDRHLTHLTLFLTTNTYVHPIQSFGEPKPCLCGAPNCRKVLAGKPQKEETPAAPLTAKGQQTQREAAAAEAFRRRVVLGKPLADVSDVVLFFNGRTARGEMARVSVSVQCTVQWRCFTERKMGG